MAKTTQTAFRTPVERAEEVISRCSQFHNPDHITLAVSGGTDSIVAADLFARIAPDYGLEPDSVIHVDTGTGIPQTRLTAKLLAERHNLEWYCEGFRNDQDSLAARVLENGWPGAFGGSPIAGGHGLEWTNRKDKPMNSVYSRVEGQQLWVSGVRHLESKRRSGNVPDSGMERDKPRRIWVSPICGWTSAEKQEYILDRRLPVSEAYHVLGFSGECTACAFDETGLLTNIDLLCPELGHCIRVLALWLYQRVRSGEIDLAVKRLCWGWDPAHEKKEEQQTLPNSQTKAMIGCDEQSCSSRDIPTWILNLPEKQIIDRNDVVTWWDQGIDPIDERFTHIG